MFSVQRACVHHISFRTLNSFLFISYKARALQEILYRFLLYVCACALFFFLLPHFTFILILVFVRRHAFIVAFSSILTNLKSYLVGLYLFCWLCSIFYIHNISNKPCESCKKKVYFITWKYTNYTTCTLILMRKGEDCLYFWWKRKHISNRASLKMMHKSITFITAKVFLWKAKKKKKCKHKPSKFRDIFQFFFGVSLFWLFSFQLIFFHSINAELILARCTHFNWNGEKKSTGLFLGHTESPPTTNHHYQNDACENACNSGEKNTIDWNITLTKNSVGKFSFSFYSKLCY